MPIYTIRTESGEQRQATAPNFASNPVAPTQAFTNGAGSNAVRNAALIGAGTQAFNLVTSSFGSITGDNSLQKDINGALALGGLAFGFTVNPVATSIGLAFTVARIAKDNFIEQRNSAIISRYRQQQQGITTNGSRNR